MAEELTRAFKGIWIPAEIWLSQDLTMTDKIIYAEIDSFCSNKKPCYAGNKHFAQLVGISENRVSHIIAKLVEMGYVHRDITYREDGKTIDKRLLSTTRGYCYPQQGGYCYPQQGGIVTDNKDTNTYTNTNKNLCGENPTIDIKKVVEYLNQKTNSHYRANTKETVTHLKARAKSGYTTEDCIKVIDNMYLAWKGTKFEEFIRPSTLFSSDEKIEKYLNTKQTTLEFDKPKEQRPQIKDTFGLDKEVLSQAYENIGNNN